MSKSEWDLKPSKFAQLTVNPLRKLWERNQPSANPTKSVIMLQAGDPTVFGNFPPHPECANILNRALFKDKFSYDESAGIEQARKAVAQYSKQMGDIKPSDVILTSGCSMAIEMSFITLANPGDKILVPRPSWNYQTWTSGSGIELSHYNLDPAKGWNVDLKHLESLIDEKTRGILINNPGNPCGNVFSKEHLLEILEISERHKLPIIADEVYEFFTFPGIEFHSIASLSKNVPILTCSGLTKRFLMPGIRMGWLIINDRGDKLKDVRQGLINVSGRNFGPNSTIQLALPEILQKVSSEFFEKTKEKVGHHATIVYDLLEKIPGLRPIMPKGAMYMMIGIDQNHFPKLLSCLEFMRHLAMEESVFVFPGECFMFDGYFRIVLTAPEDMLIDACGRMKTFCAKYY